MELELILKEKLDNFTDDELVRLYNECKKNNKYYDDIIYSMDLLPDLFAGNKDVFDVIRDIQSSYSDFNKKRDFNINDSYFTIDGYGCFNSFDSLDNYEWCNFFDNVISDIIDYLIDTKGTAVIEYLECY